MSSTFNIGATYFYPKSLCDIYKEQNNGEYEFQCLDGNIQLNLFSFHKTDYYRNKIRNIRPGLGFSIDDSYMTQTLRLNP